VNPQLPYCIHGRKSVNIKGNFYILSRRNEANDVVFNSVLENSDVSENIGASCHYYNNCQGFFDFKDFYYRITAGNGKITEATKIGRQRCNVELVNEKVVRVVIQEAKFVTELWLNLFSLKKALNHGSMIRIYKKSS
jgi:hypothetical protein